MEYLGKHLSKSQTLPYDVMKLIYEYADPMVKIRKQIDNKEYDLDEIMYNRMKMEILKKLNNGLGEYYLNSWTNPRSARIIDKTNIDDYFMRDLIINGQGGYKDFYLYQRLRKTKICGLEATHGFNTSYVKYKMIKDLKEVKPDVRYEIRSMKRLYKLWIKL